MTLASKFDTESGEPMAGTLGLAAGDREELRSRISGKYRDVAMSPELGFHFLTGAPLARMLGYPEATITALAPATWIPSRAPVIRSSSETLNQVRSSSMSAAAPDSIRSRPLDKLVRPGVCSRWT